MEHARLKGVTRLMIVLPEGFPHDPEEKLIRVIERRVAPFGSSPLVQQAQTTQYLN